MDFNVKRNETLKAVSAEIYTNLYIMLFVQMFHVMVVFVQAWFCVPKFRQNHLKSKLMLTLFLRI
jgi:hypothetical protein